MRFLLNDPFGGGGDKDDEMSQLALQLSRFFPKKPMMCLHIASDEDSYFTNNKETYPSCGLT